MNSVCRGLAIVFLLGWGAVLHAEAAAPGADAAQPRQAPASGVEPAPAPVGKPMVRTRPPRPKMPHVVMAKVAGEEISVEEFMKFISSATPLAKMANTDRGRTEALRLLISDKLLMLAAKKEGLLPEKEEGEPNGKDIVLAYKKLEKEHFPLPPRPDDEAVYAYYEAHKDKFGLPEMVRVEQIQLRLPEKATEQQKLAVRKRAEALAEQIAKGASFEQLAADNTENPKAKVAKGDLGFLPRNTDPWLKQALAGLETGQTTAVLESPVGYEILKITDHRDAITAPFANVRIKVLKMMAEEMKIQARDEYMAELATEFGVEILLPGMEAANPAVPKPN